MTTSKRDAYTMMELIFVVLIIGILAAVIIPRMAANRNDAKATLISQELAICITEAGSSYLMVGTFNLSLQTPSCDNTINKNACFRLTPDDDNSTLRVSHNGASPICTEAHRIAEKNGLSSTVGTDHQF